MPIDSPVVFPLFGINPDGTCKCGHLQCGRVGKHPAVAWGDLKLGDPVPRPEPGAGAGLKTGAAPHGSGVFVVDLDGEEAYERFVALNDGKDPVTYQVETPRGWHVYFKHPGFRVKNSAGDLAKGIDIRGERGFVVAPGSPHISGYRYEVFEAAPVAEAPAWLLAWLQEQNVKHPEKPIQTYDGDVVDPLEKQRRREMYVKYLEFEAPARGPALRGHGDVTLFEVVQKGAYDLALPVDDVYELVRDHYDPRCSPPWGDELEERVRHKAKDAKMRSQRDRQTPLLATEEAVLSWKAPFPERDDDVPTPEAPNDFGFKVRRGGWDQDPTPPKYLVDGLFLEEKVNMIFSEPGTIKTFCAVSVAEKVASGGLWLGERVTQKGRVLYLDFEDGEHELHRRVHLLTGGEDRSDLWYMYSPGDLGDHNFWATLAHFAKHHNIRFLVVDTLAGGTSGVDENDRNAAVPLQLAGRFTEATRATVLVLHHANRSGEIRGTSAFKANVDALFKLETIKDENNVHRARLTCTKSGQKKVIPISLELSDDGLRKFDEPKKDAAAEAEEKKDKRTLQDLKSEVLLLIEQQGPFASKDMIRNLVHAKNTAVSAVMAELEAAGDIVKTEDGWQRDSDRMRKERLREVIREHEDWSRGKLLANAYVKAEHFERFRQQGLIVPRSSELGIDGFLWVDPS